MKEIKECKDIILALDVASRKTGFALFRNNRIEKSGTWKINQNRPFSDLLDRITDTVQCYGVTEIIAEDIFQSDDYRYKSAWEVLSQCKGVVRCAAEICNIPARFYNPLIIKSWMRITGYGYKCKYTREELKQRMINAVTNRYCYTLEKPNADDEADAIGLMITCVEGNGYKMIHPN
jgi:Holliday junction resolvasome RuvABC endonuclease subunit